MEYPDFTAQTLDIGLEGFEQNELERLKEFIKKKEPGSALLTLPEEEMLLTLGILKRTPDSIRTTIAGLILLGKETVLHAVLPSAEVNYLHMINESEYDKRIDCAQPLLALLETLTSTIQEYNRILTIKIGLFDYEIPDFPPEVYREALLNGLVHRDYSLLSPIYLRHYPDFLAISSPGTFFGGVTPENILTHEPITRNPLLATILHRIGLMEKAGIGVKRMFTTLLSLGKEPPLFEAKEQFVQVVIHDGNVDEPFVTHIVQRTKEGQELGLTELLVLSYLKRNREIEIKTASRLLQRPDYKVKETLNSMIERGVLEPFGQTKGTVYRLSKEVFTQLRKSVEYRLHRRAESTYAENLIIEYLKENGYVTNEICRTLLRVNRSQALHLLTRLVEKGKLTKPGKGRNARYFRRHS
jgi:ATP-dependent DNA helicase RecG